MKSFSRATATVFFNAAIVFASLAMTAEGAPGGPKQLPHEQPSKGVTAGESSHRVLDYEGSPTSHTGPVEWIANGHSYEVFVDPGGISWKDAQRFCGARGGYLASVASEAENQFIYSLVDDPSLWTIVTPPGAANPLGPWLGGYQSDNLNEPAGHWHWAGNDEWGFTHWLPGEPNNYEGGHHWAGYIGTGGARTNFWHDWWDRADPIAFVCEYNDQSVPLTLTDIAAGLPNLYLSTLAWGDYDADGDLDLLLSGSDGASPAGVVTRVYRNDGGALSDAGLGLPGVYLGSAAWGDYDNDEDLDLAIAGHTAEAVDITRIYRNDSGVFVDVGAGIPGVAASSLAWGDYDNDGDLDLAIAGSNISEVYRNDNGVFVSASAGLPGVNWCSLAWGDFDVDGDLDLAITGHAGVASIFRNDAGYFTDINAGLPGPYGFNGSLAAWGDFDNDGDSDLILAGLAAEGRMTRVYRNDAGTFTDIGAGLPGVVDGSVAWGDYDNDGDLDFVLTGFTEQGSIANVYRNDGGMFTDAGAGIPGLAHSSVAWGDYDKDGDLDLAVSGFVTLGQSITRVYRNDSAPGNAQPMPPEGLSTSVVGNQVTLSWSPAADNETPEAGLSYNLRIGTTPGGGEFCSPMATWPDGVRKVVTVGNARQSTSWTLILPPSERLYWSVQSIDGAFQGSAFAPEATVGGVLAAREESQEGYALQACSSNPFRGTARITFVLPELTRVELRVFDALGQLVRTLESRDLPAGTHATIWDGHDDGGRSAPAGVYYYRLRAGPFERSRAVVLLR